MQNFVVQLVICYFTQKKAKDPSNQQLYISNGATVLTHLGACLLLIKLSFPDNLHMIQILNKSIFPWHLNSTDESCL